LAVLGAQSYFAGPAGTGDFHRFFWMKTLQNVFPGVLVPRTSFPQKMLTFATLINKGFPGIS
jgi:hypothetical protein